MLYTIVFWLIMLSVSYYGFMLISRGFKRKSNRIIFRKSAINDFKAYVSDNETKHNVKDFFKNTGINLSIRDYITGRILFLALLLLFCAFCVFSFGVDPVFTTLAFLFLAYASLPRHSFLGTKTPLAVLVGLARKNYLYNVEIELFGMLTVLKNLIITSRNTPLSAENIITNMIDFSKLTKPHFSEFLSLYRVGKVDQAFNFFKNEIGTKLGEDFASILIKFDVIEPSELIEQLELYQGAIRDRCMTDKIKKDKLVSDLAFLPVVGMLFLILLNFVAVSMFIDAISMYQELFG